MKIYIVTSGCYSDYHIEAVFTDPVQAKMYANLDSDRKVEEYDADTVKVIDAPVKARIRYNPKKNVIESICTDDMQERYVPMLDIYEYNRLVAERKLSARTLKDVQEHGKESPLLLKAMQDAWAKYKYEHERDFDDDEDEDDGKWIQADPQQAAQVMKAIADRYNMVFASTSCATE